MGKIKFTESQNKAINFGDKNLLLSAAAGSGKTACLTERIVSLVKKGKANIDEMLIVTFTKAATSEMKERISKRLREEADMLRVSEPETSARLLRSSRNVAIAEISTIHAFLYKNLKPYFSVLGISVESRILDEKQVKMLKKREIKRIVEEKFNDNAEKDKDFLELIDLIGITRDTDKIEEELYWIFERADSTQEKTNKYTGSMSGDLSSDFFEWLKKYISEFALCYKRIFDDFYDHFEEYPKIMEKYGGCILADTHWIKQLEACISSSDCDFTLLSRSFSGYSPVPLGRLNSKDSDDACAKYKHFREQFKKDIEKLKQKFFIYDPEEIQADGDKILHSIKYIYELTAEYRQNLIKSKNDLAGIEYDDLERYAIKLFVDENGNSTEIAREIGAKYKYIFVDEYQDTNESQDKIFRAISEDSFRFMVGDIKQSIYRFRGAEPSVFLRYRELWDDNRMNFYSQSNGESLFLSENFRCDRPIIDFTNYVSRVTLAYGSVGYRSEDDLVCGKDLMGEKKSSPVEVVLIDKMKEKDSEADIDSDESFDPEAVMVAKIVQNHIGRYSPDLNRIITPGDVAILMRSPGACSWKYVKELRSRGIPVDSSKSNSMQDYSSIRLLVCLLNFIDNPLREIYTIGVMRSSIFDFSVEEIALLRSISDESIYILIKEIVDDCIISVPDVLYEKCVRLQKWRNDNKILLNGISVHDMLEFLIRNSEINKIIEVQDDPREIDALNRILEIAREFENECTIKSRVGNISEFLEYLDRTFSDGSENFSSSEAKNANSVAILSIHASKGLEFPICILVETGKKRNMTDETRTILYDSDFGFGMMLPDISGFARYDNIFRRIISAKIANDSIEEEMRMLYVALTRAKNKLIITGKIRDAEKLIEKAQTENEYLNEYLVKNKSTYLEWIIAACINNNDETCELKVLKVDDILNEDSGIDEVHSYSDLASTYDIKANQAILSRLGARYDNYLENVPSKLAAAELSDCAIDTSVSELLTDNVDKDTEKSMIKKPDFMLNEKSVTGVDIGTAVHTFLQFVDFPSLKEYGFETEKKRLIEQKYMKKDQADLINKSQINRLIGSSFLDKIVRSDFVKREFRFNVNLNAARFTRNAELQTKFDENNTKITVQGVVDCVFRDPDNGKLVLVDYKTDSITSDEWKKQEMAERKLIDRHRNQLEYYAEICSDMFEEKIDEVYIYSTVLGRLISIK